jgi:superfamily II RNA helicase
MTVMTTEVYRNIAWRSCTPSQDGSNDRNIYINPVNGLNQNELSDNAVVVLDEFHYMGQPGRGGVWEIVGLSATFANAPALAAWMESVTDRRTVLVEVPGQERPVPLRYMFATKDGLYSLFRDPDAGPGRPRVFWDCAGMECT